MKLLITDSNGDSISITIGDNGSFRELHKSLEKGDKMQMNFTAAASNLENEKREEDEEEEEESEKVGDDSSSKKSIELDLTAHNSNLQLLEEQVKSCLNQIQIEPAAAAAAYVESKSAGMKNNVDIKLSISSENNDILRSKSFCRLCASRENNHDMVYLFDKKQPYDNIIEKIEDCLPIVVTKTDTLPKEACRSCLDKLELCHKFHKTVSEAEKRFLIMGGKISYDSEKTTKYCQIISKEENSRMRNLGMEDENGDVNFEETLTASQVMLNNSYSGGNSPICMVESCEESSLQCFEERIVSDKNYEKLSNRDIKEEEVPSERQIDIYSRMIRCRICKEGFHTVKKCITHSRVHVKDKLYPCNLCDDIFTNEKYWTEHGIEHKDDMRMDKKREINNHVCDKCGKKYATKSRLQFHKKYHNPDAKSCFCEICDKLFDSESSLFHHIQNTHGQGNKFLCEICGKEFRAQASVNAHQRKHRYVRSFECDICNKRFYSSDTLKMHKATHSVSPVASKNSKNFSCVYCGKTFTEKLPLTVHIMSHTENEPHTSGDFLEKGNKTIKLEEDDDRRRSERIDRPFKCTVCERTFDHSARLREHSSVHTGKRPYSCSLCGKSFKRANARKVHMVIHTGEKPYKCDLCGTNFRRAGDMRRHKKTQHGQIE